MDVQDYTVEISAIQLPCRVAYITLCVTVCVRFTRGLKQSEAELCFLNTARTLELYGVELHAAMVKLFF